MEIKILDPRLLTEEFYPKYATDGAAAIDLRACITNKFRFYDKDRTTFKSGIAIDLQSPDYAAFIIPRSGLGRKGLTITNGTGLIDSDYQGEIQINLEFNAAPESHDFLVIEPMERVAQMIILPVLRPTFKLVEEFSRVTERGEGGHGSTGRI